MVGRAGGASTYPVTLPTDPYLTLKEPVADFVIDVIDSGILAFGGKPHPYLDGHLTEDWRKNVDEFTGSPDSLTINGHGTFVAGVILRQAPTARIRMRNTLDGEHGGSDPDVAAEIRYLSRNVDDLKLLNLSFFGNDEVTEPKEIGDALKELFDAWPDLVVVAAAGNSGTSDPAWPSAFGFPRLISIGAVDETVIRGDKPTPPIASFSNYGPTVDGYAGGVSVLGPRFGIDESQPGWCSWGGSSFAAAAVTGRIAQVMLKENIDARQALERVLTRKDPFSASSGPTSGVPVPGVPHELWRPYIHTGDPNWDAP